MDSTAENGWFTHSTCSIASSCLAAISHSKLLMINRCGEVILVLIKKQTYVIINIRCLGISHGDGTRAGESVVP
jgi:hypothetical protein